MLKQIITAVLLATVAASTAAETADSARIAALEARVAQLEQRIARYEHRLSNNHRSNAVTVCSIKPFNDRFEASAANEYEARRQVRQACRSKVSDMFCEDSEIKCRRYE